MKYLVSTVIALLLQLLVISQVIPEDRRVDWESVPQHINLIQPDIQVNVRDYGAVGDGVTDDHQAIMDAINNLNGNLGYIFFPPGTYLVKNTIDLSDSCILKGQGAEETILLFNLDQASINCISLNKEQTSNSTAILGGLDKGNNLLTVADPSLFAAGDYVEIKQKNGSWDIVPISWADYSVGQMTRVLSVIGNKLLIESGLRIDYSPDLDPEIRTISPISNAGLQCLKIKRVDEPIEGSAHNIYMNMAANCFVRGVESDTSVGAHVSIYHSLNILIDGCYFHHAFKYDGVGMRGYGVALSQHTSECIITNNIFKHLRHAMMIKTGANGNIFSYNYSLEPFRSEPIPDASGDISFHGHYPFSNLWEGNIVQNIVIDHYWGPSGPYNTLFRNRAELWGIIMTTNNIQETSFQNFVGNEVTNTELLHGMYTLTGEDHFEFGNNVQGNIIPTGTTNLPDNSYYLDSKPEFWGQFMDWPSIGIPSNPGTGNIPAKLRYENGTDFTVCPDSIITSTLYNDGIINHLNIWPNPTRDIINIQISDNESIAEITLIDPSGKQLYVDIEYQTNGNYIVRLESVKNGLYLLLIQTRIKSYTDKIIISR